MKKPTGNRAWRRAAKKLRRKMGRKWRCSNEDRGHISGAWFKRHGFTELNLDAPHPVRVYIGRCDTAHGNGVEYVVKSQSFTARSLVGMTMGARKRAARKDCHGIRTTVHDFRALLRIGERLRPCPGCMECDPRGFASICDGSGVLPARKS